MNTIRQRRLRELRRRLAIIETAITEFERLEVLLRRSTGRTNRAILFQGYRGFATRVPPGAGGGPGPSKALRSGFGGTAQRSVRRG